jgi:hypothetical protein
MNQLSWLLYLASVSDRVGFMFTALVIVTLIGSIFCIITGFIMVGDQNPASPAAWKTWRSITITLGSIFMVSFFLNAAVPPKETVYAIAASEMGEQALKAPIVTKASKALESWLDRQIVTTDQ